MEYNDEFGLGLEPDKEEKKESKNINILDAEDKDKPSSSKPIHKGMLISDIVEEHPDVIPIMLESGMHCIGCGASMFETLEEGLASHGMDNSEMDRLIDDMNKFIKDNPDSNK